MEDESTLSEREEANDTDIYFTINFTGKADHNANAQDVGNVNDDTSDDQSITNSVDDGYIDDRNFVRVVLEDWLVSALRDSPDQRLTWDEVLSRYRTSKSALLQSWYMSLGPEGLFHYFTTLLPDSLLICHNYINCKTTMSHSTPPTTTTRTSSTNHDGQAGYDTIHIAERDTSIENAEGISLGIVIASTDSADLDANAECIRTSDNLSFISYHSYAYTHSLESLSVQNNDDDNDENVIDFGDTYSVGSDDLSGALGHQYCDYDNTQSNKSILRLSPMESPDYKNYSMQEVLLYPGSGWSNNIVENHWKHYVTMWLLNLFKMNSSNKLRYDFVAFEFMTMFGTTSASILLKWVDKKDIAGAAFSKSTSDGELYVVQSSTLVCSYR